MPWEVKEGHEMAWALVSRMYNPETGEQRVTKVCEVPGGVIYKFTRKNQRGDVAEAATFVPVALKRVLKT